MIANTQNLVVLPHVDAVLNYLAPTEGKPCRYAGSLAQDEVPGMAMDQRCRQRIHDARSVAHVLSLESEGCQLVHHRSAVRDFWNEDAVRRAYYPEMEALITAVTGACWAFAFDHTVRRRIFGLPDRTPGAPRQPRLRVEVDYTEASAPQRARELTGHAADSVLRRRFAFINAWRPIRGPLYDAPLALCDGTSIARTDLVATDCVQRDRAHEIYSLTYSPAHRWLYIPGLLPDQVLLFKGYDSRRDAEGRFVAHSAFEDPSAPADRLVQESIELAVLAIFP
jgi:hypothetical protein